MTATQSELERTFANLTSSKNSGNRKTAKRLVRNKSAIQDLQKSLNDNPRFGKMVEYSVGCLKNMAVDEVCVEELIDEGVLDTLMRIQKLNPYNENVHRIVNECIAAFCINDDMARLVAEKIGAGNMIFSCQKHVEPETIAASTHAMSRMMRNIPENINAFVEADAINALDHVASTMNNQPEVMAHVAECLRCISFMPEHIPAILKTQLLQNLLKALKDNPQNSNLVENTLAFLAAIAAVDGPHIQMLRDLGVVDLIVAALEAHSDNRDILKLGADALRHLAGSDDIFNALRVKIGLNDETANALSKLASLMLVEENIDKMIDAQGIQWLIEALQTACKAPPSDTSYKIMVNGCRAVDRICNDEKKIYAMMQAGAVPTVLAIISTHGKDESILVAALHALARMITRKENAEFLLKCKVMGAVDGARKLHPDSARVALPCADICERLSKHPSIHPTLLEQNIIPILHQLLKQFKDDEEIVKLCLKALENMSASPQAVQQMMDLGIADLIAVILKQYEENPEVVGLCLDYLAAMTRNHSGAAEYLKNSGIMKAVLNALDKLRSDVAVQKAGSELMKLISGENQLKDAIAGVWSTAQHILKNPQTKEQVALKLQETVTLLKNLALVDANHSQLLENNAQAALLAAIEAAMTLNEGATRTAILTEASIGLERLSADNNQAVAKQVLKNGKLFTLLNAIINDPDKYDEQIAETAMTILAKLSEHPSLRPELIDANAVQIAVKMAKIYPYNEAIQAASSSTLGFLCVDPLAAAQMVQSGGAKTIIESLYTNITSKEDLMHALDVLRKIAVDPDISQALWDAGVLDAIIAVWKRHVNDHEVVDGCLQALITMLVSEEIALEMGEKGVCDLAIPAIRSHYRQPILIENDVVLLDSLASAQPNAERLLDEDFATIELMEWVVKKFKNRPTTVDAANRLIQTLDELQQRLEAERLEREVQNIKLDESSVQELFQDMLASQQPDELKAMFQKLELLMTNPEVVKMLAKNGGLHSMSQLMLANIENEETFKAAASVFLRLCCDHADEEINELLQHPVLIQAHAEIIKPKPHFSTPMTDEEIVQTVVGLGHLKLTEDGFKALYESQGLAQLTKLMGQHSNPDLLREAARVLGKASGNEVLVHNIIPNLLAGSNGFATIRELIDALRKHINNYEFVRFGIYILGNLAVGEQIKTEIGIQSGIQLIIQAIVTHPDELALIKNAFYALTVLTFNHPINCAFVMASQGIPLTLKTMKAYPSTPDLLDSCICVLCNMCHGNDGNKGLVIHENGAQIIVDTVLNNFDQVDVLLSAFKMLRMVAYNAQAVDAIIKAGGVQGIVAGMTVLGDNIEVVDVAIRVLTTLTQNCTDEHIKIMAEEGAVQAIVEVAAAHTTNVDIELSSVTSLCNLSVMHYNSDLIIKQGGVEVVITALGALGYDPEFVEMAIRLLYNLTYSVNNLNRIINAGLARSVLQSLKSLMTNAAVVTIGLRCISNLCYSDEVATRLADDGPIEFVLELLKHHTTTPSADSSPIIAEALLCLSALCRSEDNALAMATQSVAICLRGLQMMGGDTMLVQNITRFLANLFCHSAASISAIETELVPQLLTTITFHIQNIEVILLAVKPIENMAYASQTVRDYLKEKRAVDKMIEIQKANTDRQDVQDACNNAIYAINKTDYVGDALEFVELNRARRNIKDVYEVLGEKKDENVPDRIFELPPKVKNFLTAGSLIMKHSNSAPPRPRHVYVTDDLMWIVWKDPKKGHGVDPDTRMKIFQIRNVERGRCTPQLQRTRLGKFNADEKCAFSIQGRSRTIDLEANSEKERERWVHAVEMLIAYKKGLQQQNAYGAEFK